MSELTAANHVSNDVEYEWLEELTDEKFALMVELLNEVAESSGTNGYSERMTAEEEERLAYKLRSSLRTGDVYLLFGYHKRTGEFIGSVALEKASQPARKHVIEVKRAVITRKYRGRFLSFAVREVFKKCRQLNFEVIQIDVSEDGPTRLWERFGFRTFGRMPDYARVGDRKLDGYYMALNIND